MRTTATKHNKTVAELIALRIEWMKKPELKHGAMLPRIESWKGMAGHLGIPPITFLRRKRLGDAHAALLMAGPAHPVKQIAIEHGFAELGRFAIAYRRQFGERPSQTLHRRMRP